MLSEKRPAGGSSSLSNHCHSNDSFKTAESFRSFMNSLVNLWFIQANVDSDTETKQNQRFLYSVYTDHSEKTFGNQFVMFLFIWTSMLAF